MPSGLGDNTYKRSLVANQRVAQVVATADFSYFLNGHLHMSYVCIECMSYPVCMERCI